MVEISFLEEINKYSQGSLNILLHFNITTYGKQPLLRTK